MLIFDCRVITLRDYTELLALLENNKVGYNNNSRIAENYKSQQNRNHNHKTIYKSDYS